MPTGVEQHKLRILQVNFEDSQQPVYIACWSHPCQLCLLK